MGPCVSLIAIRAVYDDGIGIGVAIYPLGTILDKFAHILFCMIGWVLRAICVVCVGVKVVDMDPPAITVCVSKLNMLTVIESFIVAVITPIPFLFLLFFILPIK